MKVLLTGANGFIGRHVMTELTRLGIEVIAVGLNEPPNCPNFIRADILNRFDHRRIILKSKATHLIHLAWYTVHNQYWTSPLNIAWSDATIQLVQTFCELGGQKVVIAGTCAEYDWQYGYCLEDTTPLNPSSIYGLSKDVTRKQSFALCSHYNIPCIWGRVFFPFGPGDNAKKLIPSLIQVYNNENQPFSISINLYRDFIYVTDVASGFVKLLLQPSSGEYNISSNTPTRLDDVILTLATLMRSDPEPILKISNINDTIPISICGDNRKLCNLGWRSQYDLKTGLDRLLFELRKEK